MRALFLVLSFISVLVPGRAAAFDAGGMDDMARAMTGMMSLWTLFNTMSGGHGSPFPGLREDPWSATADLDGRWQSPEGAVLEIRGRHFRLRMGSSRPLHGTFRADRTRFIAHVEETGATLPFVWERRDNAFILLDPRDHMILFRRRMPGPPGGPPVHWGRTPRR